MPYDVRRSGSKYDVVDDNGKIVGSHPTRAAAERHQRALYANVPDASKSGQDVTSTWQGQFFPRRN